MKTTAQAYPGTLLAWPVRIRGKEKWLDGFWRHDNRRQDTLIIFVHGMHSNFYRSHLKKAFFREGPSRGCDVLSFNTRGAEAQVAYERFEECLDDIQTIIEFAREQGYRRLILAGHSTGCQKIVYYQARRKHRLVKGLVLLAPGDDYAIARRDAGARFGQYVQKARHLVREGSGDTLMKPKACLGFSARRYLSIADPTRTEAKVFNYEGRLYHFRRIRCPMMLLFGAEEEYACLPVPLMHKILRENAQTRHFSDLIVPGADHGFHGCEQETAEAVLTWIGQRPT